MFNREKLTEVIAAYKETFPKNWKEEKFKWEAVQHFQKYWDINAENFLEMFMKSTEKTTSLLANMNNYPRSMIKAFAENNPEAVRAMFNNLFDESNIIKDRIDQFQVSAKELFEKYNDGSWNQHYQSENAITTYLWLKYPDKYYIYKYSVVRAFAKVVENDFVPKRGNYTVNVEESLNFYNNIREIIEQDSELDDLLRNVIDNRCYADPYKVTMTIDIGFFATKYYNKGDENAENAWFASDYSPNLSVDDWLLLLQDSDIFKYESLQIMKRMMDYGGEATCKQLSNKYGESANFYNIGSSSLARRVAKKTECPLLEHDNDNAKYWPILYIGKYAKKNTDGIYIWKFREELKEAISKVDLSNVELYAQDSKKIIEENNDSIELYRKNNFLKDVFITEENYNTLVELLKNKKNLILQGAPGVGKTYVAKRLSYSIMGEKDDSRIEFIQFHQNYSYEDFIMGYKPCEDGFKLTKGIFYEFCLKAAKDPDKEYFFIIDEINRGNMSKIFGELLMLIEKDYRGKPAKLAYSGEKFSVPENLYIIGMMNTADRSLAMIDYALRRRFSFYEMEPAFESDKFKEYQSSLQNELYNKLIEIIINLNKEITADASLGAGFRIGHSYFCGQEKCTVDWMKLVINYDILPMLREYWFDDHQKLQDWESQLKGVLNDKG